MANIFEKISTLVELERAYEIALESMSIPMEQIEMDYIERKEELQATQPAPSVEMAEKTMSPAKPVKIGTHKKLKKPKSNAEPENKMYHIIWSRGTEGFPSIDIEYSQSYRPLNFGDISTKRPNDVSKIEGYAPEIIGEKLFVKKIVGASDIASLEQQIYIAREDKGISPEFSKVYTTQNQYINDTHFTIVLTILFEPKTYLIAWQIKTVYAKAENGDIIQLFFKIIQ